jgi:hypothetical protein
MHEQELPEFQKRKVFEVLPYANKVFTATHDGRNHLIRLIPFPDGHFRAVFHAEYFQLQSDQSQPSKSQWGTLKKKLKRHNRQVFVFKAFGTIDCNQKTPGKPITSPAVDDDEPASKQCYYLDFGFFLYD